jgi:hypothetical protein
MKRVIVCCWLMFGCLAAGRSAQVASLGNTTVSSVDTAKLSAIVRKQIERELFSGMGANGDPDQTEDETLTKVEKIRLGPGNHWGLRVWGGGASAARLEIAASGYLIRGAALSC